MKICYQSKNFSTASLEVIAHANAIVDEYQAEGLELTLRQLYYQFVSRALIPNTMRSYKRLGSIVSDGRMAGLIDWSAIEDRTRNLQVQSHWDDPGEIIRSAAWGYRLDKWENQDYRVEVWIEKEALLGVISTVCNQLDVPYFACKGYVSQSEMWSAAQRMRRYTRAEQQPVIIHLGDHDPSGIDMTRDIDDRQQVFEAYDCKVKRIALNMDQVDEYDPPPNPAKLSDSRASGYIAEFGASSWELDALEPRVMRDLITRTVQRYRDETKYEEVLETEKRHKAILDNVAENWETL